MSLSDYAAGRPLTAADMAEELMAGRLEMAQTYAHVLGRLHSPIWVVDSPFLFRDHEHAARVLEGGIGDGLRSGLPAHGLRGLAFTYSGGFRILTTTGKEIHRVEDMRGLRIRTSPSPVATAVMESFGATAVPSELDQVVALTRAGSIDGAETPTPATGTSVSRRFSRSSTKRGTACS